MSVAKRMSFEMSPWESLVSDCIPLFFRPLSGHTGDLGSVVKNGSSVPFQLVFALPP